LKIIKQVVMLLVDEEKTDEEVAMLSVDEEKTDEEVAMLSFLMLLLPVHYPPL
jgi:hypothetical protein